MYTPFRVFTFARGKCDSFLLLSYFYLSNWFLLFKGNILVEFELPSLIDDPNNPNRKYGLNVNYFEDDIKSKSIYNKQTNTFKFQVYFKDSKGTDGFKFDSFYGISPETLKSNQNEDLVYDENLFKLFESKCFVPVTVYFITNNPLQIIDNAGESEFSVFEQFTPILGILEFIHSSRLNDPRTKQTNLALKIRELNEFQDDDENNDENDDENDDEFFFLEKHSYSKQPGGCTSTPKYQSLVPIPSNNQAELNPGQKLAPKPSPQPPSKPEPKPKPKSELNPEPKSEPKSELKPKLNPELNPEPKSELKSELNPEPKPKPKSELKPDLSPEPKPKLNPELNSELKSKLYPEPNPEPKPKPKFEPKPEPKSELESELKLEPNPEPKPKPKFELNPEPKSELKPEPTDLKPIPSPTQLNSKACKSVTEIIKIFEGNQKNSNTPGRNQISSRLVGQTLDNRQLVNLMKLKDKLSNEFNVNFVISIFSLYFFCFSLFNFLWLE